MNITQLKAVCGIAEHHFNMSEAALALHRSQPALSRQIALLERELGVRVFQRTRNRISGLTAEGLEILAAGKRIARELEDLRVALAGDSAGGRELRIATTHTHARFTLPRVIKGLKDHNPGLVLNLRQGGNPAHCAQLVADAEADIGVTTDLDRLPAGIVAIPAYKLSRCLFARREHPITKGKLTLQNIARYPLIAYSRPLGGRWIFGAAFASAGLEPQVVLNAIDADVSKTYVSLGIGIAVLASIAYDPVEDRGLVALDVDHLFRPGKIVVVLRDGAHVGPHIRSFMSIFAPHLDDETVRSSLARENSGEAQRIKRLPTATFHLDGLRG